jgi:putative lipoic acid-binding regulatory protein
MNKKQDLIEKLENAHSFPGPYTLKVIGENLPDFREMVLSSLGELTVQQTSERLSSNKRHLSLTIVVLSPSAEAILDAYERLSQLQTVKYVL